MNKMILIVDDEKELGEMVKCFLENEHGSRNIILASNVTEARAKIDAAAVPFGVVVTDYDMPDGTGLQVAQAAKARSADTQVVIMSGRPENNKAHVMEEYGIKAFLNKPTDVIQNICNIVRECLHPAEHGLVLTGSSRLN